MTEQRNSEDMEISRAAMPIFGCLSSEGQVRILEMLNASPDGLSFKEIHNQLREKLRRSKGVPASSVSNYLKNLGREELVEQPGRAAYKITEVGALAYEGFLQIKELVDQHEREKRAATLRKLIDTLTPGELTALLEKAKATGKL